MFVVYKSSAGSGKTYTLVKEYLKLALSTPSAYTFKNILAITFTNKAASEMKERVISSLAKLSLDENAEGFDNKYFNDILKATNLPPHELRIRAQNTFSALLHNYSDFAIGTIDSFVHRVVRSFAFDLGIPLSFNVELDADKLLEYAIDELISRAGTDPLLTRALVDFTENRTDEERSWRIENELKKFASSLLDPEGKVSANKLKELSIQDILDSKKVIDDYIFSFKNSLISIGNKASQIIEEYDIPTDAFAYGKSGIAAYFNYLKTGKTDKFIPGKNTLSVLEKGKWHSAAGADYLSAIDAAKPQLEILLRQAIELVDEGHERFVYYSLLNKSIFSLALLNELQKIIDEYRNQTGTVHISEFDERLGQVVQNEPAPYIYERLGEKYKYYLIDEFQDTSSTQWHNLLPLIENSLAGANFNMVVGDGKQAIYRWRGGDVEQFANLPNLKNKNQNELIKEREEALIRNFVDKNLDTNFRSKKEIVDFNNRFFEFAAQKLHPKHQPIYYKQAQLFNEEKTGGVVHFEFLADTVADGEEELTYSEIYCRKIHELVIYLKDEGYQYGDIAVLVRKNFNGIEVAQYLSEQKIPVLSNESLLLIKSPTVNLLIAFLKRFVNPTDQIATATLLEGILRHSGRSDIHIILQKIKSGDTSPMQELHTLIPGLLSPKLKGLSLFELIEEAARLMGLTAAPDAYLQQLFDVVLKFMADNGNNPKAFLEWWAEDGYKLSISVPEDADAVRVMSIHKSKGLQFPVVIFSHANWREQNKDDYEWIDNEDDNLPNLPVAIVPFEKAMKDTRLAGMLEEEELKRQLDTLNLLYVAMTRPEERLYVISTLPGGYNGKVSEWYRDFFAEQGQWQEGKLIYQTDNIPAPPVVKKKKERQSTVLDRIVSSHWDDKIIISIQARKVWDMGETPQITYGKLVHQILAWVNTPADLEPAITKAFEDGLMLEKDIPEVRKRLQTVFDDAANYPLFTTTARVWIEREIILPGGKSYRPDRVVQLDDKLVIADYKTGKPDLSHEEQINMYAATLRQMGYSNIETKLIYL